MKNKMKKNFKLWPVIVALVIAGIAGTGCTAKVKKAYHERKAQKYFAAGDLDRAEIEYLNVLKNDRENVAAVTRLGGIYYDQGRLQRAAYFLGRASTLATNDTEVRLKLGFIYSTLGQYKDARAQAEFVLSHHPQDDQAPMLLAEASLHSNDIAAARLRLQALAKTGDRAPLEVALGNLAFRQRDFEGAAAAFHRAQALDAKSSQVNSALAAMSWLRQDLPQAEAYFKAAAEASPKQLSYQMQYARFKMRTGRMEEAQQLLSAISSNSPSYVPAMMARAEIAGSLKQYEECEALLTQVLARDEYNFEAMLFKGQVCQLRGDAAGALQAMGRMVRQFPQSPLAYYSLAKANVTAEDTASALANLSRALDLQPEFPEAIVLQAQLLLQGGNANPVIVALEKLRSKQPDNVDAQLLLADAYRIKNRMNDAIEIYRTLGARFTNNIQLPMLLGAAYLQTQNAPGARAEFSRALRLEPDNLTALNQLVDADIAQKKFDDAAARLQAEIARRPQLVDLHLMLAKLLMAQGDQPGAKAKLMETAALDPKNPFANLLLAQVYVNEKDHPKALAKLQEALASSTNNVSAWMMSAAIHEADKEYASAAADYEKVLALAPKFSPALNNLACLYSEHLNQLDRAFSLAQEGRKLLPYDPSAADTLGWIHYRRGDYPSALALLKESVAKPAAASVPEIQYHYGMASYMMTEEAQALSALTRAFNESNDIDSPWRKECEASLILLAIQPPTADAAAQKLLEKRLGEKPKDPVALNRLAAILARDGQVDQALATYQSLLNLFPSHLPTVVSMARLYAGKDPVKACQLAKDAYKLAPYDAAVQHLLGQLAYATKDFKLSVNVLQEAVKQAGTNALIHLDLARANFTLGRIKEAQGALTQALALNPAPDLAANCRQMLELADSLTAPSIPPTDSGRLAAIIKQSPDYLPALAVQAGLSAQASDTAAAVANYEKILTLYPDFAPAQKSLALLYLKDPAKHARAYELAVIARNFYPEDAGLTKVQGIIQFEKGDYPRALSLLKQSTIYLNNDPEVFYYLGATEYKAKDRAASKASLQRALNLKLTEPLAESARKLLAELK
jgi:tetratricopeptide (TPR) repeat protein